jgi:exonuclease VII large subunit
MTDRLDDELEQRLKEVRQSVQQDMRSYRNQRVEPELASVSEQVQELHARLDEFEERFNSIVSPADGQPSTHEERVIAIREMLRNKAEAREHGTVGWKYRQIQDQLESNGHGKVHAPQAYRIMEDAAEAEGYAHVKDDGGEQVLRCSLSALADEEAVNIVNNAPTEAATDGGRKTSTNDTTNH